MIFTSLERIIIAQYQGNLELAFVHLFTHKELVFSQPEGRYDPSPNFYYMVQKYTPGSEADWESHFRCLDLHILVSGMECIEFSDLRHFKQTSYAKEADRALYAPAPAQGSVLLGPEDAAIFYPEDAHRHRGIPEDPYRPQPEGFTGEVHKIVYKILLD